MMITLTPDEERQLLELQKKHLDKMDALTAANAAKAAGLSKAELEEQNKKAKKLAAAWCLELNVERSSLYEEFEKIRFDKIKDNAEAIIENAREQVPLILTEYMRVYGNAEKEALSNIGLFTKDNGKWLLNTDKAISTIRKELKLHFAALARDKKKQDELIAVVTNAIDQCGLTTNLIGAPTQADNAILNDFMPIYNGRAINKLALISNKATTINTLAMQPTAIFKTKDGFKAKFSNITVTDDIAKVNGKLNINLHKLVSIGVAELARVNNCKDIKQRTVSIPLKEYLAALGCNMGSKEAIKTARRRLLPTFDTLYDVSIDETPTQRSAKNGLRGVRLVSTRPIIERNNIVISFTEEIASYLCKSPMSYYQKRALLISPQKPNAYCLWLKLSTHYNIDNNKIAGTHNRLKIQSILEALQLPSYDSLKKSDNSRHWSERIKEPFETSLDELTALHILKDWKYTRTKGEPLADHEAYNITDYNTFANLLLQFEFENEPDQTERRERRAKDKAKAAAIKANKEKRQKA